MNDDGLISLYKRIIDYVNVNRCRGCLARQNRYRAGERGIVGAGGCSAASLHYISDYGIEGPGLVDRHVEGTIGAWFRSIPPVCGRNYGFLCEGSRCKGCQG